MLTKIDEREFEVLFRSLLRSLDHRTIFERTRHGPGEHGKDIVSLNDREKMSIVNVYQLKVGDISTNRFRTEIKPEFDPMFMVPISHPIIKGTEPKEYTLVSTGDFSPDAAIEFDAYNKYNIQIGRPEIQLLNRSNLIKLFYDNMESLPIFATSLHNDFARIWLNIQSDQYNRLDWFDFVDKCLQIRENEGKPFLFLGLSTAILSTQAYSQNKFYVAFDVFKISLVKIWILLSHFQNMELNFFDSLHKEYYNTIQNYVDKNVDHLTEREGLFFEENGVTESIGYPIRTFSTLGTLAYMAYFLGKTGNKKKEKQIVELIETIINNNPSISTPVADYLRKDIAITLTELCRNRKELLVEKWINNLLENLYQRYIRSGWYPSISEKAEDIVENAFRFKGQNGQPESFLIPILFKFCAKIGLRNIYEHYRVLFNDFRLLEFIPPDDIDLAESEIFQNKISHGATIRKYYPDFDNYCGEINSIGFKKYSPIDKGRSYVLQLITDVYLHYVFPEIYLTFD